MDTARVTNIVFIIVLMFLSVFLLFQAGSFVVNTLSSGNDEPSPDEQVQILETTIDDYIDSSAKALLINNGEINSNEEHRIIEIEVTPVKREIRIIQGYNNVILERKTFKNNQAAYEEFMKALAVKGIFNKKDSVYPGPEGVCASGKRMEISLSGSDAEDFYTWTTNCTSEKGILDSPYRYITDLFNKQIPDYRELTRGVVL